MKDPKAAAVIEVRLKYDWIVLLYGLLCVLVQLLFRGDVVYFFSLVIYFSIVEVFSMGAYRNLLNGEEGFHTQTTRTLDQQSSVELIVFCIAFDFVFLIVFSMIFFAKLIS